MLRELLVCRDVCVRRVHLSTIFRQQQRPQRAFGTDGGELLTHSESLLMNYSFSITRHANANIIYQFLILDFIFTCRTKSFSNIFLSCVSMYAQRVFPRFPFIFCDDPVFHGSSNLSTDLLLSFDCAFLSCAAINNDEQDGTSQYVIHKYSV